MSHSEDLYDIVVFGAGSAGYAAALRGAQLGLTVALVERYKLGGTCLHNGCIPTKAILHAAELADQARQAGDVGVRASFQGIDMDALHAYKNKVVSGLCNGLTGLVAARGITYVEGEGRLSSATSVDVGNRRLTGRHIVLATGSVPRSLPGLEIDGHRVISSDHALNLDRVPKSMIVLGGGVIGVEFASAWAAFGAKVAVVEALPRLVPAEDEDISSRLEAEFLSRGIGLHLGVSFAGSEYTRDGIRVRLADGTALEADLLLVAVGRGPVSQGLGYEEAGIAMQRGHVLVDEYMRTNVPTVSAIGDLVPTLQLAHVGFAEGILVADRLAGKTPVAIDYDGVPRVTFSRPEIASVGLTEAKANQAYGTGNIDSVVYDLANNARSRTLQTEGHSKVVRRKDGAVIGIHMIGDRMSEQIGEAQLIYNWEALPQDVAGFIHAYPTQGEALGEASLALTGKPLHLQTTQHDSIAQ
ncbi:dihydrolipoyl dehydrogenase [Streptomyces sp. NPDC005349]|uniref:dihydrolipoyl dehydrogenase n=1 Tax=Streptomyces sp. NPDC005349 TaxID=3157037 RepID=UPI0033BEC165